MQRLNFPNNLANDVKNREKTSQANIRSTHKNIDIDSQLIFEEENTSYELYMKN